MNKKTIATFIVLIFLIICLGMTSAANNTTTANNITENSTVENIEDTLTDYIIAVHITDNGIEFSDGFTGFCIDSAKNIITSDDKFTSQNTGNDEIQNNVKLTIIECYKLGKQNDMQNAISQVLNGNKNNDIAASVLDSAENIGDTAVVKINNNTEATFTFELLKPVDDGKSECLAYKVSLNTIESNNILTADNETNDTAPQNNNITKNTTNENNATAENTTNNITKNTTNEKNASAKENKTNNDTKKSDTNQTTNNVTNKNETNTLIVNKTNTTVINQNNTKIIEKTDDTPKNTNIQNIIARAVGNPLFLLMIVIVIIAIIAVVIRRKG